MTDFTGLILRQLHRRLRSLPHSNLYNITQLAERDTAARHVTRATCDAEANSNMLSATRQLRPLNTTINSNFRQTPYADVSDHITTSWNE